MAVCFYLRPGFSLLYVLMCCINHQSSTVFIHRNYCLPAAHLSTTFCSSVTVLSTCYITVYVQLFSNFTITPTCLPVVVWPAVQPAGLPSGLFPVVYIGAGMFYNRPVLLWCRPGLNAVPFRPGTRRSVSAVLLSILLLLCGDIEQNPGPGHTNSSTLNIGSLNICTAANKTGCIHDIIFDRQLDVLALCETRFQPDDPPAVKDSIAPDDYSVLHAYRDRSRAHPSGGGLALIHRNSVVVRPHPLASALSPHPTFELQLMKITSTTPSLTVATVYRPPQTSLVNFYVELADLLTIIISQTDRLLVLGDFNCPGDGPTTIATELSATFESLGLLQHVREPTRHENLLDLVVTDKSLTVSGLSVDDAGQVSDHRLVTAAVSVCPGVCQPVQVKSRRIRGIDTDKFEADLRRSVLFSQPSTTADGFAAQLQDTVVAALNRVAPIRTRKRRPPKPITRWLSDDAVEAKRLRRRLEKRWKRDLRESDRVAYRLACRRANKLINSSRQDYFSCQIANAANCKDRWRVVKHLLHSSKSNFVRTDAENAKLCTAFCDYFVDKISRLKSVVSGRATSVPCPSDLPHVGPYLDFLTPVTPSEVNRLLSSLPCKSSPVDYIPTSLIKSCSSVFSVLISTLANLSFSQGTFPSTFKFAVVSPLLKKPGLDADNPANFRPISNLNNISKIIERLFLARLQPHVTASPNFNQLQSAYRQHHSTETALLVTLNSIFRSSDEGKPSTLISLDLSAAFDMIDHRILLSRLYTSFGITGPVLNFIESYLTGRSQCVRAGQASSRHTSCNLGVPQGSVLGPILFSLYTSPIGSIASNFNIALQQYADDTQLFFAATADSLQSNLSRLELCLATLHSWFCSNGLALNGDKSEAITFGTRQKLRNYPPLPGISIAGSLVPLSNTIKTLGITLDSHLTLDTHVSSVCKSAFYHIRALRHIRNSLTDDTARAVAVALVQSRLDYCNSILYGISKSNLTKLQRVQNSVARIVLRRHPHCSSADLLRELHWLPIEERIKFKLATITYNALSSHQPPHLSSLLHPHVSGSTLTLRSTSQHLLAIPRCKTEFGKRAFSCCAPSVWCNIPVEIRSAPSISIFKRHLKTHFFGLTPSRPATSPI